MKKLSLSLLALLLAATSFAAPPGWVEGVASKDVNAAVAADPSAIHRGGALIVDHATLQTQLLPWSDGDSITLDFVLPPLSNCAPTPVGWECDVDGSTWRAGVADLDGVKGIGKLATALDDFDAPGAQSYVRIPFGEVFDNGSNEWTPVEKQLGGDWQDFSFNIQPTLTPQQIIDGFSQADWVPGSIAIYHKSKANDNNSPRGPPHNYMTGKAAHMPAPVAVGFRSNQTTITGWCYGWFEFDDQTGRIKKVFPYDVVSGWSANTASVVIDATIGYTEIGALKTYHVDEVAAFGGVSGPLPVDGDYQVDSIHNYVDAQPSNKTKMKMCLYNGDGTASPSFKPGTPVADSLTDEINITLDAWNSFNYVTKPTLSNGDAIYIARDAGENGARFGFALDSITNNPGTLAIYYDGTQDYAAGFPESPFTQTNQGSGWRVSAYITVTAVAPPSGATPTGPMSLSIGLQF